MKDLHDELIETTPLEYFRDGRMIPTHKAPPFSGVHLTRDEIRLVQEHRAQKALTDAPPQRRKVAQHIQCLIVELVCFGTQVEVDDKDWIKLLEHLKRIGWTE